MIALGALVPHDLGANVVAYTRVQAAATLTDVVAYRVATVGASLDAARWESQGAHFEAASTTYRSGRHAVRGVRDVAFITAPSIGPLVDALRRHLEWRPGTSLHHWRQGRQMDAAGWEELGATLHRFAFGDPEAERPPDGLVITDSVDAIGLRPWGALLALAVDTAGVTVRTRHWRRFGRHLVPRAVWATLRSAEEASTWWDGRTFGRCEGQADLPEHVRRLLDRSGRAERPAAGDGRPLTDYQAAFIVRQPTIAEVAGCQNQDVPPVELLRPALLVDPERAIPLPSSGVRVIAAPDEALSVFRRCTGRAFVPHAPPLTNEALVLGARPRWYVGALPRTVAHG